MCVAHDLLNTRLIHRELRQMLFGRYMRRRHLSKLLLHLLKNTVRLCYTRCMAVSFILSH